jgi:dynein heavy chain
MIYLEPSTLGWRPIMRSWLNTLHEVLATEAGDAIEALFEWLVDPCLDFVRKNCKVI